jgi:Uma2 family endonuclease
MSTALHLTAQEFDKMVEQGAFNHLQRKIELIRGELREMNPAGPFHVHFINFLNDWSVRSTKRKEVIVSPQNGMDLSEQESRPEPDLVWMRAGDYRHRLPGPADTLLAIEVADSSLKSDLGEKADLYAEAGIADYWVVDVHDECIHVFRSPAGGKYHDRTVAHVGESIRPLAYPAATLVLRDLFAEG